MGEENRGAPTRDELLEGAQITALEILRIKEGDTIVIRADATTQEQVDFIMQAASALLQQQGLSNTYILILPGNLDIKILNADQMRRQGWVRAGKIHMPGNGNVNFPGPQPRG